MVRHGIKQSETGRPSQELDGRKKVVGRVLLLGSGVFGQPAQDLGGGGGGDESPSPILSLVLALLHSRRQAPSNNTNS